MARSRNNRRGRRSRRPRLPMLCIVEDTALATQDTVSNGTLYSPPISNTGLDLPSRFRLRSCEVVISPGSGNNKVFAVVRRVPSGYSAPSITITNGIGSLVDCPDVLAYGLVNVFASTTDTMERINLKLLRPNMVVYPGDVIYLQVVPNANSTGQVYNALAEYDIGSA